ncbi:Contactin [Halotydeus destructor]|nr:Contactin [Halotydeus destructor]
MNLFFIFVFLFCISHCQVFSQHNCPNGWVENRRSCYKFSRSPRKSIQYAEDICQQYNSHLISVNSYDEHVFIAQWLRENDPQHLIWFTSGRDRGGNNWGWDGDKTSFTNIIDLWVHFPSAQEVSQGWKFAAYNFSQPENRWGLIPVNGVDETAYICEIGKEDLRHVLVTERGIDYGIDVPDKRYIPRGPQFSEEPKPAVFDVSGRSQINYISLRCVAEGYPTPTYEWFKEEYDNVRLKSTLIDPLKDDRVTLTDGTLTIYNPQPATDRGKYHCKATNIFGSIMSETVQLSFGFIGEFNKKRSADHARENWGKSINCDAPQFYPRVNYYWTRNSFPNFVEEDRRVFVSFDGNIYFSTVEKIDRANYSCNVQSVISSTGRTGPFFPLVVDPGSSGQKLLFPNNFPKAFPEAPLAGEDVRLECVAYGYPVPSYNWTRLGVTSRLPEGSYTTSHNRVLMLPKVKVEDAGDYQCTATSGRDVITKFVTLSIQAMPTFTVPLSDKVMDRAGSLVWTCEAFGIPEVSYKWFKNGRELDPMELIREDGARYKMRDNILSIDGLTPGRDEGMFQCMASNALGSKFSAGQLKIISLKPSFKKYKMDAEMYAAVGSNYTIPCTPEAVPFPQFQWKRNGQVISGSGRVRVLPSGFLFINPVDSADSGEYTCIAKNDHGIDQTTGYLTVFRQPQIVEQSRPREVAMINETIQLRCFAYADESLDIAYVWLHNELRINFTNMPQYAQGDEMGYLKISNITFAEAGEYVCIIKTSVGMVQTKTELIVHGPPNAPGAVLAEEITSSSARVLWSDGSDNGRRILAYTVQGKTNHNSTWLPLTEYITQVNIDQLTSRRSVNLQSVLSPWSTYEFRVIAISELGSGPPSLASPQYNTDKDRPLKTPTAVGGGGGKSGTLTITWNPLPPQDWNAPEIWYQIYYKGSGDADYTTKDLRQQGNIGMFTVSVGEENYYKPYSVAVRAKNPVGEGPASNEVEVFSAEAMPHVQPSLVQAISHNSTALNVSWAPVDITREKIRGKLIGHRIKYWRNGHDPQTDSLTLLSRAIDPWGLIVALQPDTEYYVAVMAYNDAGSGPESEPFLARTYKAAPQRPPTSVKVTARDETSVMVIWRGVSTISSNEEPIIGYKVRYWESDQPIAKAKEVFKVLGGELEAVISGLVPGKVYKLRVMAYSHGGDGKMSSPAWEFRVGEGSAAKYTATGSASISYLSPLLAFYLATILRIWF